jgi:ferredoxin-NADP reductase
VTGRIVETPGSAAPAWEGTLRVDEIVDETPLVKTFRLTRPEGGAIPFDYLPGQYLSIEVTPDGKTAKRSYTIASSPAYRERVELTVKREEHGLVSRYLHEALKVGDMLKASGPSGLFTFTGTEHDRIALIAAGVGITPVMSVVRYLTDTHWPGDIHLLLGFRNLDVFIFRRELETLAEQHRNLRVTTSFSGADGANEIPPGRRLARLIAAASTAIG